MEKYFTSIRKEELDELKRLEIRHKVSTLLYSYPELYNCDRMLIRWLSGIIIRAQSEEEAIQNWRKLLNRGYRTVEDYTYAQVKELSVTDEFIANLFRESKKCINSALMNLEVDLVHRVTGKYGHFWNDEYESRQRPKRSLDILYQHGIRIHISNEYLEQIKISNIEDSNCPILDKVKNMRIVTINGFPGSKMSLTVHDIFDHFWLYSKLNDLGILDKYSQFLQSVGNPQDTDIFNREGELIASICFDYRGYTVSDPSYKPLFSLEQVKRIIRRSPLPTNNQLNALNRLNLLDDRSDEAKGLCFSLSGLTIELMEQRRKHGFIRALDSDFQIQGNLSLLDPEYVALVVETNAILFDHNNKAREVLFNISLLVEDYLMRLATDRTRDDLIIKMEDLENVQIKDTCVPPERIEWISDNIGFVANRRDQC